jgi:hypothetical protein
MTNKTPRAGFEHARQVGDHLLMYVALGFRSWAELRAGHLDAARRSIQQAEEVAAASGGQLFFTDWFISAQAELELASGAPAGAILQAQRALEAAQQLEGIYSAAVAKRVWGMALAAQGQVPVAREHLAASIHLFECGAALLEAARTRRLVSRVQSEARARARPEPLDLWSSMREPLAAVDAPSLALPAERRT